MKLKFPIGVNSYVTSAGETLTADEDGLCEAPAATQTVEMIAAGFRPAEPVIATEEVVEPSVEEVLVTEEVPPVAKVEPPTEEVVEPVLVIEGEEE